jgi:hypothetical protein
MTDHLTAFLNARLDEESRIPARRQWAAALRRMVPGPHASWLARLWSDHPDYRHL